MGWGDIPVTTAAASLRHTRYRFLASEWLVVTNVKNFYGVVLKADRQLRPEVMSQLLQG